jgi:hypothetical protein
VEGEERMDEEVGESVGWHEVERGYWAPVVARARFGFLVTLVDLWTAELVLMGDEAVGADAEGGGGGQAIVVDRIGLGVHQKRMAGTRGSTDHTDVSKVLMSSIK